MEAIIYSNLTNTFRRWVQPRLKSKLYRVIIRPTMFYDAESFSVKNSHAQKMNVAERSMLRWMCGNTQREKIRNEDVRHKSGCP